MNLQKRISICSGFISLISLSLAAIFYHYELNFLCSVFVGLFSSGILICITSIITYFSERNKAVLSLYNGCYRFMKQLNSNLAPGYRVPIEIAKNNLSAMMDSYSVDIYCYVCELSGLCKASELHKIITRIWDAARKIYLKILEDHDKFMEFYLGDISKSDLQNYKLKYTDDESIKCAVALRIAMDDLMYHMNYYNSKKEQQEEQADAD